MLKLKERYKDKVVGFNNSTTPLGYRDDLDKLAEISIQSNDPSLLELFEEIPSLEKLYEEKGKKLIEELKKK